MEEVKEMAQDSNLPTIKIQSYPMFLHLVDLLKAVLLLELMEMDLLKKELAIEQLESL